MDTCKSISQVPEIQESKMQLTDGFYYQLAKPTIMTTTVLKNLLRTVTLEIHQVMNWSTRSC